MNWIKIYHEQIEQGKIAVSARLKRVYSKLVSEIDNPTGNYHFDEEAANRPIEFIERFCRNSKGEWFNQPLRLELFQKAFISALFGFVDDEGKRRFREAFFYVSRKNGKSVLLAAIGLYCLIADHERGAEIYSVATKKDQAQIVFTEALNMVKLDKALNKAVKKRKSDLYFAKTFSKFQALGKNYNTLDGLNCHLCIVDEAHAIQGRELYEVMKQSQSARKNPLLITITTAGTLRESIFDDLYSYACKVADETIDDKSFLPIMYELDNKTEWQNPAMWQKANPALGTIKKVEDLQLKVKRAAQSPNELIGLLTKDFNVIENQASAWLTFDDINNTDIFNLADFKNFYAVAGVDLSLKDDLTCATLLLLDKSEKVFCHQMYWLPSDELSKKVQADKIPYDVWHQRGLLRLCQGNTINFSDITNWFLEIFRTYQISFYQIYYDPYSAGYWAQEMTDKGFKVFKLYQTPKNLSLPMQKLAADLQAKKLNYNNNPILKFCLSNTGVLENVKGEIIPQKCNGNKYKIDGTAALLDAYAALVWHYKELLNVASF